METKQAKQAGHTPGPWAVDSDGDGKPNAIVTSAHGDGLDDDVCEVYGGNDDDAGTREANARLIAAAPELLAACKAALEACEAIYDGRLNWHGSLRPLELVCRANKDARAAITKATT